MHVIYISIFTCINIKYKYYLKYCFAFYFGKMEHTASKRFSQLHDNNSTLS